jgi:hypothetical protein
VGVDAGLAEQAIAQFTHAVDGRFPAISAFALVIRVNASRTERLRTDTAVGVPVGGLLFTGATTLVKGIACGAIELPFSPAADAIHGLRTVIVLFAVAVVAAGVTGRAIRSFADFAEDRRAPAVAVAQADVLGLAGCAVETRADFTGFQPALYFLVVLTLAHARVARGAAEITPETVALMAEEGERLPLVNSALAGVIEQAAATKVLPAQIAADVGPQSAVAPAGFAELALWRRLLRRDGFRRFGP